MPIFFIETEISVALLEWMEATNYRLQGKSILRNPFMGQLFQIPKGEADGTKIKYYCRIDPVYYNFAYIGSMILLGMILILGQWTPWMIIPIVMIGSGLLHTQGFYAWMMMRGLYKAGHREKVRLLSLNEGLRAIEINVLT